MAEEFVELMLSIKKVSTEEKLDILTDIVEKIIFTFIKIVDNLNDKIILLENQVSNHNDLIKQIISKEIIESKTETVIEYTPKPHINKPFERSLGNENTRKSIMKELNEVFKKNLKNRN
jgi:hypothetical protein